MNHEFSCDIIRDLLPGYADGLLSEAGTALVEEHLKTCVLCQRMYLEMKEDAERDAEASERLALDGFKKVRRRALRLKLTAGIAAGLLLLVLAASFLKIFVLGEPLSPHELLVDELSYDEETGSLSLNGSVQMADSRVSRVVWKEDEENADTINVFVYVAKALPFQKENREFSLSIPHMKGKTAYLASQGYTRLSLYDWSRDHYEQLARMEEALYLHFPELDPTRDALSRASGITQVQGKDGISYSVHSLTDEGATFWKSNGQLITDGDFTEWPFDLWISLEEPYEILVRDSKTGAYTENTSLSALMK